MSGDVSAEERANWIQKGLNMWITPLLQRGSREVLTPELIWRASERHMPDVETAEDLMKRSTLFRSMIAQFRREWLGAAAWRIGMIACQFAQPFLVRAFVAFLTAGTGDIKTGLMLAFLLGFVPIVEMLFVERSIWLNVWTSQRIRTLLVLLVNRKLLVMRKGSGMDVGVLLSVDVDRLAESAENLHFLWRVPLNVVSTVAVLMLLLGPYPALAALGSILLVAAFSALCNRKFSSIKKAVATETDGRAKSTRYLVQNLENIKSASLETVFGDEIESWRGREMSMMMAYRGVFALFKSITLMCSPLALFAALVVCMLQDIPLNAGIVFGSFVVLKQLDNPILQAVEVAVSLVEARVSLHRMQQFCRDAPDVQPFPVPTDGSLLSLRDASFSWSERSEQERLQNDGESLLSDVDDVDEQPDRHCLQKLSLSVHPGEFVWVTGRVGAGKSSLLAAAMGELILKSGSAVVCRSALFCGQNREAALVTDSIPANIEWGSRHDEQVLRHVLRGTGLDTDVSVMVNGENTVVGESGVTLSGGQRARVCLARAVYRCLIEPGPHLLLLDDPLSAVDGHTARKLVDFLRDLPDNVAVMMTSHHTHLIGEHERVILLDDGKVVQEGSVSQVRMSSGLLSALFAVQETTTVSASDAGKSEISVLSSAIDAPSASTKVVPQLKATSRKRGHVGLQVYKAFFGPQAWHWSGVGLVFAVHFGLQLYSQLFVARLSSSSAPLGLMPEYGILTGLNVLFFVGKTVLLFLVAIKSAAHLHSYLVKTLLSLTKGAADTTSMGVFVTAATSEMDIIDNKVAPSIETLVRQLLSLLLVIVLGSVSTYGVFALVVAGISAGVFFLARWFGKSTIEIARSVSSCKAPVVARILEEEQAVLSIRSFGVQDQWRAEICRRAWTLASANLASSACNRWMNLRLSVLGGLGVWALSFFALAGLSLNKAYVALGVAASLDLRQIFNMSIQNWVTFENAMQACEQIRQLGATLEQEDFNSGSQLDVIDRSVKRGALQFEGVSASYRPELPLVLDGLSFDLAAGEKVAICGRTGSGKSTLGRVLLRLLPYSGSIFLDGIDISDVSLRSLRQAVSVVTQSSLVFPGSAGSALDPDNVLSSEQRQHVLSLVGLQNLDLGQAASSLSAGQLQLVSFGRGLARALYDPRCRVLLLDEASSSIDSMSEQLISSLLKSSALAHVTVLVIAHRTASIMVCSRVLVLHLGRLIEQGNPAILNANPESSFYKLVNKHDEKNNEK